MSTDFRELCAELLKGLDENRHPEVRYPGHLRITMANARAALAQPGGGLVERVHSCIVGEPPCGHMQARAAIREVAAAAKDLRFTTAKALIAWLEREASR